MPFKEACIALVDELDASAAAIQSINTIVNTDGHLKAYNTDYIAIAQLLENHQVPKDSTFALRGSGGMAKAVASALRDGGYENGLIVARNERAGQALAQSLGYEWQAELGEPSPADADQRHPDRHDGRAGGRSTGVRCLMRSKQRKLSSMWWRSLRKHR